MKCGLCDKNFKHLGSHLWHAHKVKAREYKQEFGLNLNFPLIDPEIRLKMQASFKKKSLKNLTKKYQFKPGQVPVKGYISRQSRDQYIKNLKKINSKKPQRCPICNMKTRHLASHLFNKYGLLITDKQKFDQAYEYTAKMADPRKPRAIKKLNRKVRKI